jgi:7,8-dihydropterin-6-yl-methyl-4-(beta-D-ribofuranosyl)aminobenzene 5'-phosphate synthase
MPFPLPRRQFLQQSGLFTGSVLSCSAVLDRKAAAQPVRLDVPVVDRLTIQVVLDGSHDVNISDAQVPGIAIKRVGSDPIRRRTLQSEWGLALHLQSFKGSERRTYLLDFGYTADVLNNNLELLNIDVGALDGLILSHGHLDHYGGLSGFLEKHRMAMKSELCLYAGGEDVFCYHPIKGSDGNVRGFVVLDRRDLAAAHVRLVLSETPRIIDGHAFTTGAVPRNSIEKVLPNGYVEFGMRDGAGCSTSAYSSHHFTAEELAGSPIADQHWHEHATCYRVGDRGLVVITSCGHSGIINALRRAQEITGVGKIYALVGGFHLAPASDPYLAQVMAELKTFDIDHVIPMHCSGSNFLDLAKRETPEKLVLCTTGSQFTFSA